MNPGKVKVLYIGGYSRSGSTLLLRLLGRIDGLFSVGELWNIWERSFEANQLCGCGQPFDACPFWNAVTQHAFGSVAAVDTKTMQHLRHRVQDPQAIPALRYPALRLPAYTEHLRQYADVLQRLYTGIQQASGCRVIVDSSKVPQYAYLLQDVPNVELHVVHLVRDSRAAAYSWQRKKVRPEIHWQTSYMERYSSLRAGAEWMVMNGLFHGGRRATSYQRVRYEDLCAEPAAVLQQIGAVLGEEWGGLDVLGAAHEVEMGVDHTASGNPNRFVRGAVKIEPDTEWQHKMAWRSKALVTGLTWPLLLRYGYFNRRERTTTPHVAPVTHAAQRPTKHHASTLDPAELSQMIDIIKHEPIASDTGELYDVPTEPVKARRILFVTPLYLPHAGGTEIHTYEMARRLAAAGHHITVLTTDPKKHGKPYEENEGIRVIRVPSWPANSDYYFSPGIFRTITKGHWDLIHCQGYHSFVAPTAMLAAQRMGIPYLVTFHSGGHSSQIRNALRGLQWSILRPLLARAERLIAVSVFEANLFRERLGLGEDKFVVIPNGSHLPPVAPSPDASIRPTIVSVGRLERYKGHHRVIAAMPIVAREYPNIQLRIVGAGPYEAQLRQYIRRYEVEDRVDIRPVDSHDRAGMASILANAKLVILMSDYESQSVSVMEAVSLGRSVLVADSSALHELADKGLVRVTPLGGTVEEVAAAMLRTLKQPHTPQRIELPSWDACYERLTAVYDTILQGA